MLAGEQSGTSKRTLTLRVPNSALSSLALQSSCSFAALYKRFTDSIQWSIPPGNNLRLPLKPIQLTLFLLSDFVSCKKG